MNSVDFKIFFFCNIGMRENCVSARPDFFSFLNFIIAYINIDFLNVYCLKIKAEKKNMMQNLKFRLCFSSNQKLYRSFFHFSP